MIELSTLEVRKAYFLQAGSQSGYGNDNDLEIYGTSGNFAYYAYELTFLPRLRVLMVIQEDPELSHFVGYTLSLLCPCGSSSRSTSTKEDFYGEKPLEFFCHQCGASWTGLQSTGFTHLNPEKIKAHWHSAPLASLDRPDEEIVEILSEWLEQVAREDPLNSVLMAYDVQALVAELLTLDYWRLEEAINEQHSQPTATLADLAARFSARS